MAKYNVGVGDAFPADGAESAEYDDRRRDERDERDDRPRARDRDRDDWWNYRHRRHRTYFFRISALLLLIWGVLSILNHAAPHGLLVAAGITFAIGVAGLLFRSDRDWEERRAARRAWREERRARRWEDR